MIVNGVETDMGSVTKNRLKYLKPWGKANFVESNVNDDFWTADREDYSLRLVSPLHRGSAGKEIAANVWSGWEEMFQLGQTGNYLQLGFEVTRGALAIGQLSVSGRVGERGQY
jgi:hypothetical protein